MIIDISVAVIAAAIVILTIFLIIVLLTINKTLRHIHYQLESFDSLLRSVSNVGDVLEQTTDQLKEKVDRISCCPDEIEHRIQKQDIPTKVADALTLTAIAISLWQKIKKRS